MITVARHVRCDPRSAAGRAAWQYSLPRCPPVAASVLPTCAATPRSAA
ncbi:hypothetical protein ACFFX0_12330 [Citricoccus parietis]|uniref:Uncharacterized protein n=1 Tax=Citricoccus parietis TaxID=592307 RepID=A0ABV5FZ48_9MICC